MANDHTKSREHATTQRPGPHEDPLTASSGRPSDERVTCGALGRKVRTETSSRKESSEQERTTDQTLLCHLAGHREKGSAHTTMIALMFLLKKHTHAILLVYGFLSALIDSECKRWNLEHVVLDLFSHFTLGKIRWSLSAHV